MMKKYGKAWYDSLVVKKRKQQELQKKSKRLSMVRLAEQCYKTKSCKLLISHATT